MRRGQQLGTGSGRAGYRSKFSVTLKRNGASIKVKVGDTVASLKPGNATLTVPPSSLSFGVDNVNGECFPGGTATIQPWGANGLFVDMGTTVADDDGVWTVAPLAVNAASTIKARCGNANGDAVFRSAVAIQSPGSADTVLGSTPPAAASGQCLTDP